MINAGKQGVFSWKGRVAEDKGEKNGELKEIVKIFVSILKPKQTDFGEIWFNLRKFKRNVYFL